MSIIIPPSFIPPSFQSILLALIVIFSDLKLQDHAIFQKKADEYLKHYVDTKNFMGAILVAQKGVLLYSKAFGMADTDFEVPNRTDSIHTATLITISWRTLLKKCTACPMVNIWLRIFSVR